MSRWNPWSLCLKALRVRLGGFQAYFVGLSREQQDFQIARVEQQFP